jgi:NAD(P)-dependent dehydrogenase (short-subunit alcohol dehydrogenase family)
MTYAIYPSLKDRVVLITGGAGGIGAEHVMQFAAQGARVGFIDYNPEAAAAVVDKVRAAGHAAPDFLQVDLRDIAALEAAIAGFIAKAGPVTVLVNNAAHDERHTLMEVTSDYFDERIAFNLKHMLFCAKAVAPGMKAAGGGSIVNFGSFSWRVGLEGMPVYVTAKAGIEGLTKGLARELGGDAIRVNCVIPGWIMTERQLELWVTEETKDRIRANQCLKDLVMPADVSRMALWLAADDSRMCSSQFFTVDGGWSGR